MFKLCFRKSEEELSVADANVLPERPDVLVPGDSQNMDTVERDEATSRVSAVEESETDVMKRCDSSSAVSADAIATAEPTSAPSPLVTADVIKPPNPASPPLLLATSVVEQNQRNEELNQNGASKKLIFAYALILDLKCQGLC